jgi:hypothetical protein
MKHKSKFLGILGIVCVLTLALCLVPALPVSGVMAVTIVSPATMSGAVGSSMTIFGSGYTVTSPVGLYFSSQAAAVGGLMGTNITSYATLAVPTTDASGTFTTTVAVPTNIMTVPVTPGTYYIYTVVLNAAAPANITLQTVTVFTVTGTAAITLTPTTGAPNSSVTITGLYFPVSTTLAFRMDTATVLTPTAGQTATNTAGAFTSIVTVPIGTTAGAHTITATAGAGTATATYTVTVSAALDPISPASGAPGIDVVVSGANFPSSTALVIRFETTTLTVKSGDSSTRVSGIFISTVTIPAGASSGAHTITVTAGTASATGTFTVSAPATPTITVTPASGLSGRTVTVAGTNFTANAALAFTFDGAAITPKSGDTAVLPGGGFSTVLTIPATTAGAHTISATDGTGTASGTFTATASTATLTISANGDSVGALLVLVGAGFRANTPYTIKYDTTSVATGTVDATGRFVTSPFAAPAGAHGAHNIVASDGFSSATAVFTVEATAPSSPQAIGPALSGTLKSPYTFTWASVTDPSAPVTYDLQIGTSPNFEAGTTIIDKTGITADKADPTKVYYNLTDAEVLRLPTTGNYYWRERGVDAAANASVWSTGSPFKIATPFKFAGTPLYLTMAGVGIVLFLLGLWIGRKTAFSY